MRAAFHWVAYHAARLTAKCLLGCVTHVRVLAPTNRPAAGPFILAANHISHFDPPLIAGVVRQKVDWMAMAEFFPHPLLGPILRAIECFPADRHRANRQTIRTALDRLRSGRIVGMFPEGGIRDGSNSVLEGAPLRPGVSTLAHMAGVSIVPCVILGSDRLYAKRNWLPFRRTPIWIGFGQPVLQVAGLDRAGSRAQAEQELAGSFRQLYEEMRTSFSLTADDLPHSPKERMSA